MPNSQYKDIALRGLSSIIGGPVDLATMLANIVLKPINLHINDNQAIGSSEWIGDKLQDLGLVSSARYPAQEFAASIAIPTPTGIGKSLAIGSGALIGNLNKIGKTDVNIIPSATKKLNADHERLYHAGNDPVEGGVFNTVPSGGVFDGFFSLKSGYGNYGTGAKYYADIPKDKILSDYDLNYNLPYDKVKKELNLIYKKKLKDEEFDDLWTAVVEDAPHKVDSDNLLKLMGTDDIGDASWEAQKLRGQLAKKLGYNAIEMNDENGISYLITSGTKLLRDID